MQHHKQPFEEYFKKSEVGFFLQDVIRLVLAAKPQRPIEFINNYFKTVVACENVFGREYAYVNGTLHNRKAFTVTIYRLCEDLEQPTSFAVGDLSQIILLVCADFPLSLLDRMSDLLRSQPVMALSSFVKAFAVYFYYQEFFTCVDRVFHAAFGISTSPDETAGSTSVNRTLPLDDLLGAPQIKSLPTEMIIPFDTVRTIIAGDAANTSINRRSSAPRVTLESFSSSLLMTTHLWKTVVSIEPALSNNNPRTYETDVRSESSRLEEACRCLLKASGGAHAHATHAGSGSNRKDEI